MTLSIPLTLELLNKFRDYLDQKLAKKSKQCSVTLIVVRKEIEFKRNLVEIVIEMCKEINFDSGLDKLEVIDSLLKIVLKKRCSKAADNDIREKCLKLLVDNNYNISQTTRQTGYSTTQLYAWQKQPERMCVIRNKKLEPIKMDCNLKIDDEEIEELVRDKITNKSLSCMYAVVNNSSIEEVPLLLKEYDINMDDINHYKYNMKRILRRTKIVKDLIASKKNLDSEAYSKFRETSIKKLKSITRFRHIPSPKYRMLLLRLFNMYYVPVIIPALEFQSMFNCLRHRIRRIVRFKNRIIEAYRKWKKSRMHVEKLKSGKCDYQHEYYKLEVLARLENPLPILEHYLRDGRIRVKRSSFARMKQGYCGTCNPHVFYRKPELMEEMSKAKAQMINHMKKVRLQRFRKLIDPEFRILNSICDRYLILRDQKFYDVKLNILNYTKEVNELIEHFKYSRERLQSHFQYMTR